MDPALHDVLYFIGGFFYPRVVVLLSGVALSAFNHSPALRPAFIWQFESLINLRLMPLKAAYENTFYRHN